MEALKAHSIFSTCYRDLKNRYFDLLVRYLYLLIRYFDLCNPLS